MAWIWVSRLILFILGFFLGMMVAVWHYEEESRCSVNNYAAIGYALLAADEMELSKAQKERLWQLMYSIMDVTGESKAEKRFKGAVEG